MKQQGQAHNAVVTTTETSGEQPTEASEAHLWYAATNSEIGVNQPPTEWILDSGATHHMCTDRSMLFGTEATNLTIQVANSTATLKGNCLLETTVNGERRSILLTNVFFCESLGQNLLSLSQLRRGGLTFNFSDKCTFYASDGSIVAEAIERGGLWIVNAITLGSPGPGGSAYFVNIKVNTLQKWHERLGHVNYQDLLRMASKNLVNGIALANKKATFCMACAEGKQSRNPQPMEDTSDSAPTDEIGAVICMDLKTDLSPDRTGHRHILTIVGHASNYNEVYLLHAKSDAFDKFLHFANTFQRQYNLKIKVLRTDGRGEFINAKFSEYAERHGIRLQISHPNTSASNGKAERYHRTLMNSARAMLWASSLPKRYWGDAVLYASYIRNRVSTRSNADHKSPLEVLTGKPPRVSHIFTVWFKVHCTYPAQNSTKSRQES